MFIKTLYNYNIIIISICDVMVTVKEAEIEVVAMMTVVFEIADSS